MKDFLITVFITIAIYLIAQVIHIKDEMIQSIIDFIPIAIPTITLWLYTPKNYLKFISLKSIDVIYDLAIKIEDCTIDQRDFEKIRSGLRLLYKTDSVGSILNENMGDYLLSSTIDVDTTIIKIAYYIEDNCLFITSRDKIKYKSFFKLSQMLFDKLTSLFATEISHYKSILINLDICFKESLEDEDNKECQNPFLNKIFEGFHHKIISFKYKTKNDSIVEISNHNINFTSNNINKINEDINKELRFFLLRN